jgi:hypothetical protein
MNDLQFAVRCQCLPIRCSGRLISLRNKHSIISPDRLGVLILTEGYIYIYIYIYIYNLPQLFRYSARNGHMNALFSDHYLRNRSTLDIGVLGYIGIF